MTTKEKQALIANQVDLHCEIVKEAHINIVNCGNCGSIFLHRTDDNDNVICPFCYENMAKSDCPDYFYTGLEFSGEFEFNNEAEATEIKEKNTTETIENNKLIAEFMGYIDNGCSEEGFLINPITNYDEEISQLQFHSDWNWLMEVITNITIVEEFQDEYEFNVLFWDTLTQLDINDMHVQVVLFIKWYNENK